MGEERVPSAAELDEQRRRPVARWMLQWLADREQANARGPGANEASARLDWRGVEIIAGLVRLQVCRGKSATEVARTFAGELSELAETYERCAALPEAAERELDAARAVTFRSLADVLGRGPTGTEPAADRCN